MAEQNPSLHIDSDWKKQAQEEKRKLAEAEKSTTGAESAAPAKPQSGEPASGSATRGAATTRGATREMPPASFATLVQTVVTQALFYLGDLAQRGSEPTVHLDMAKHQIDLLGVLEEKTANNLAPEEKKLLDAALYETRMRYISVSSQFLGP